MSDINFGYSSLRPGQICYIVGSECSEIRKALHGAYRSVIEKNPAFTIMPIVLIEYGQTTIDNVKLKLYPAVEETDLPKGHLVGSNPSDTIEVVQYLRNNIKPKVVFIDNIAGLNDEDLLLLRKTFPNVIMVVGLMLSSCVFEQFTFHMGHLNIQSMCEKTKQEISIRYSKEG